MSLRPDMIRNIGVVAAGGVLLVIAARHDSVQGQTKSAPQSAKQARSTPAGAPAKSGNDKVPRFEWDPTWPQPFPNDMVLGQIGSVAVDSQDHVWIAHHTDLLSKAAGERVASGSLRNFGTPAPPLVKLDQAGKILRVLGGPSAGFEIRSARGLHVDGKGNIWVNGAGPDDAKAKRQTDQLIKLSPEGKFLMQIGHASRNKGSHDIENVAMPNGTTVDVAANEVYVADGYVNHRVIVFDATTGAYKRHWGAYGKKPDDAYKYKPTGTSADPYYLGKLGGPPPPQFNFVTCVRIANDGLVYVCDRDHGRIQVFRKDGTYVTEFVVLPRCVADLGFSADPAQEFMYFVDFIHERVWILRRSDGTILGSFGHPGRYGGQFTIAHNIAVDRRGNIYVGETWGGRRVQRFLYKGLGFANASETIPPPQYEGRFDPEPHPPAPQR